jgi:hypothetical protein
MPKLLRKLFEFASSGHQSLAYAHAADLICGAFFLAMRSCEYCLTAIPGRAKMITLSRILFCSKSNTKLAHSDPQLAQKAKFVTITFVNQKNGKKMDSRTQSRRRGTQYFALSSTGPPR